MTSQTYSGATTHKIYLPCREGQKLSTEGKIISKDCNVKTPRGDVPSTPPPVRPRVIIMIVKIVICITVWGNLLYIFHNIYILNVTLYTLIWSQKTYRTNRPITRGNRVQICSERQIEQWKRLAWSQKRKENISSAVLQLLVSIAIILISSLYLMRSQITPITIFWTFPCEMFPKNSREQDKSQ